jgi:Na+-translocating ferredoxin:NAD+ oxidoreductase subunit G
MAGDRKQASAWSSGVVLAIVAAICTALVAITYGITAPRIDERNRQYLEDSLSPALADIYYDNELSESILVIPPPHDLPGREPVTVYRLYRDEEPAAAVFIVNATGGYAGPIRLLIGVEYSGEITAVRVLSHNETPGLGDLIESSRSNWLQQFEDASLGAPPRERWTIKRDGGEFDQLTGASVTPRAVVRGIKETLIYFEANRERLFAARETETEENE